MKKNIAFLIYSLNSGGAERVVSTLANGLCNNFNVTIITLTKDKPFYQLKSNINLISCHENRVKSNNKLINSLQANFHIYKNIKKVCRNHSIDIIIGFMTESNVLAILTAKSIKIPVIVSERNYPPLANLSKFWKVMRKITYGKSNILVVQTKPILNFFKNYMKEEKIKILANPISKNHIEAKNNLSIEKENIILNVGSLNYQKGQDIAIKAFAKINPPNWQLHLVGEGPKRKEYTSMISELGMEDKIILTGRKNQISNYLLKAKIFIFPSRFEGFPNALTEAMYLGLPCISTDCPTGPTELIMNGVNGFLTPVDNIDILAETINELISNTRLRKEIGLKAAESVSHLEEHKVTKKWEKLIKQTLQNS
ncbi:glycosyltransferase family 4 protein [Maribacter sp. R86514]|uniref:glycosyltransferase family 4 protein n=1 Tax=Maribacter sp. R86514 TaxID=3093854 RepID=UPI0037C70F6B